MSKIEWTEKTWNPVTGCSKVSAGCRHCYAERISLDNGWSKYPWKAQYAPQNVVCREDRLAQPAKWKQGAVVFVNSMSDLFHEQVPDVFLDNVFAVMAQTPRHFYLILTKRPARMQQYLTDAGTPLANVGIGVSVEDQKAADERIPLLLDTPATMRFLSCEPLIAHVYLGGNLKSIDWVICGGESGPGCRGMSPVWANSLKNQCVSLGVPFFFKQWGGHPDKRGGDKAVLDGQIFHELPPVLEQYTAKPKPVQRSLF